MSETCEDILTKLVNPTLVEIKDAIMECFVLTQMDAMKQAAELLGSSTDPE